MGKIKLKMLLSLLFIFILLASTASYALYGTYFYNNFKPNFPITNIAYYVDSSVSGYASNIETAFNNWKVATQGNNVNARVWSFRVYSTSFPYYPFTPHVIFKKSTNGKSYTTFYDSYGNQVQSSDFSPPTINWSKCIIYLSSGLSDPNFTITHEIGHIFGLSHPNEETPSGIYQRQPSCMIPSDATGYDNVRSLTPTPFDVGHLNDRFR
jgi:hypothetical protein